MSVLWALPPSSASDAAVLGKCEATRRSSFLLLSIEFTETNSQVINVLFRFSIYSNALSAHTSMLTT
jgi:hypothetical protein